MRPIWIQFNAAVTINTTGTTAIDLLDGHIDTLQQSERTVVAVKASLLVDASTVAGATPDSFRVNAGLTVGPSTMVAADFPDLDTDGIVAPGWMWRRTVGGVVTGDGTNSTQVFSYNGEVDASSKRSLKGIGLRTLWVVYRIPAAASAGTIRMVGQILLAQKG